MFLLYFYSLRPVNSYTSSNTRNHAILFVVVMTIIIHSMGFPETIGYKHMCREVVHLLPFSCPMNGLCILVETCAFFYFFCFFNLIFNLIYCA